MLAFPSGAGRLRCRVIEHSVEPGGYYRVTDHVALAVVRRQRGRPSTAGDVRLRDLPEEERLRERQTCGRAVCVPEIEIDRRFRNTPVDHERVVVLGSAL